MSATGTLPLRHALALGLLHGPAELLPVSSSGHTTLVPWLAGWPYASLDPRLRKSFEIALHAGTAAALLARPPQPLGRPGAAFLVCALAPPAAAGYALHARIENRLGTPRTIAAGLLAGSVGMAFAEWAAFRNRARPAISEAGPLDGLVLGLAQALALAPGISRSGAAYAAARARRFRAAEADRLSWQAGLPVLGGAAALQSFKLARQGAPPGGAAALAVGAGASFASTLAAARLLGPRTRAAATLPLCAYRAGLACAALARVSRAAAGKPPIESHLD